MDKIERNFLLVLEEIESNISCRILSVSHIKIYKTLNQMFKTFFKVIVSLLLTTGTCDLIGFNRLGNNVKYHIQNSMEILFAPADYRLQYRKWFSENNVVISDDNMWLEDVPTNKNRRLNHYLRGMENI